MRAKSLLAAAVFVGCAVTSVYAPPAHADDPAEVPWLGRCEARDPYDRQRDASRWEDWFRDCEKVYTQIPQIQGGPKPDFKTCRGLADDLPFLVRVMSREEFIIICTNP